MDAEDDDMVLYDVKSTLLLGNYGSCINHSQGLSTTQLGGKGSQLAIFRDVYMYRAFIAQGDYTTVLDEVAAGSGTPPELQAVRLLAEYLHSRSDDVISKLKALLGPEVSV